MTVMDERQQHNPDLICCECPLDQCDDESLWCAFRWATNPNEAQRKMAGIKFDKRRAPVTKETEDRREYYSNYYFANRDRIRNRQNARNARLREERA